MRAWVFCAAATGFWAAIGRAEDAPAPFTLTPAPTTTASPKSPAPTASDASPQEEALVPPVWLALVDQPQNVYPEIMPPRAEEGANGGKVNFGLDIDWLTAYVFRGINQNTLSNSENSLQFNATAKFDLGKLPHPFIGLFVNVFNSDPISRFEEVRPFFGLEWNLKPITVTGGYTSYILPNRKYLDTSEVFLSLELDDSRLFHTATPLFTPYIYGAYDVDLYKGFYLQTGIKHDLVFEDWGVTITPMADLAYVINDAYFSVPFTLTSTNASLPKSRNYGLQHYDLGTVARLSLNHLFNVDRRYGEWSVNGYLYYTARIDSMLRADTLIYGGVGLQFRY